MNETIKALDFTNLPPALVTALGKVTARTGQIEHLLVVTLKRTTDGDWREVFDESEGKRGDKRRSEAKQAFREWARNNFDNADHRIKEFDKAIDRIGQTVKRRNKAIHSAWGFDKSRNLYATNKGKLLRNDSGEPFSVEDVEQIADELHACLYMINAATNPHLVSPTPERDKSGSIIVPKNFVVYTSAAA